MMLSTSFTQIVVGLLAASRIVEVSATPIQDTHAVRDISQHLSYPVTPMKFEGTINGIPINASGTIEEIYAQAANDPFFALTKGIADVQLVPQEEAVPTKIICIPVPGQNWQMADQASIEDGIKYLRGMVGYCPIAPQNCHRVSCSWNAGIYVCNDNNFEVRPLCSTMGAYAQEIINAGCTKVQFLRYVVGGQAFGQEGFNIIVHSDSC